MSRSRRRHRRALAGWAAALLAAGCAATEPAPAPVANGGDRAPAAAAPDAADPATEDLVLSVEADHVTLTVPDRLRAAVERRGPREWRVGGLTVRSRESDVRLTWGGDALAVVAEGIVKTVRTTGVIDVREGPFRTLILRDGRMLRR